MMNILNGGAHTSWQSPMHRNSWSCLWRQLFRRRSALGAEIYHALKTVLKAAATPPSWEMKAVTLCSQSQQRTVEVILEAIEKADTKRVSSCYRP
jgi:enolase